jgi:intracellular multiplication protein IcmK
MTMRAFLLAITGATFAFCSMTAMATGIQSASNQSVIAQILQKAQQERSSQSQQNQVAAQAAFQKDMQSVDAQSVSPSTEYPGFLKQASSSAFSKVVRNTTPMTPSQIETLHGMINTSKQAVATFPGTPPKPTSSSVLVHLAPGSSPPVIRLRNGYVTAVLFLDATGQPWPIHAYDIANSSLFNIHWDQKSNILLIQAKSAYQQANLAVMLKGLNTPVMITLIPGQVAVDYRVDMRIPRMGPQALAASVETLPGTADPRLLNVLDGIPPEGSKALTVSQMGTSAWIQGKSMFLRTPLTLLSPSFQASVSSSSGMHAFEVTPSPVILVMEHGKITKLLIKGF